MRVAEQIFVYARLEKVAGFQLFLEPFDILYSQLAFNIYLYSVSRLFTLFISSKSMGSAPLNHPDDNPCIIFSPKSAVF